MTCTIATENEYTIQLNEAHLIKMPSRFTSSEVKNFENHFQSLVKSGVKLSKVILDFGKTNFMDGSGLICLDRFFKVTKKYGVHLLIEDISAEIKLMLSLIGVDEISATASNTQAIAKTTV